jgi:hypothetical protein
VAAKKLPPKPSAATVAPSSREAVNAPIQRKQPDVVNDAKWRAAVQAQEERVRAAAEERLRERIQAANNHAAEATSAGVPAVSPDITETLPTPSQSIDAPPERMDPDVVAIETPPLPKEQQPRAFTTDAPPSTPAETSTHTGMPFSPESANEIEMQEPAALQPSVDVNEPTQAIEAMEAPEEAPPVENSPALPLDANELPADAVGDRPRARADEPAGPEASF